MATERSRIVRSSARQGRKITRAKARKVLRGFAANAARIARRQGISLDAARSILAAAARRASPAALRRNPRLRRVLRRRRRRSS